MRLIYLCIVLSRRIVRVMGGKSMELGIEEICHLARSLTVMSGKNLCSELPFPPGGIIPILPRASIR